MARKHFLSLFLVVSLFYVSLSIYTVKPWDIFGEVYIRADGSIDPLTAPINRAGDVYTLTVNVDCDIDGIVVERNNTVIDGAGHTIQGPANMVGSGVYLGYVSNVTIRNINIRGFWSGIWGDNASLISISETCVSNNSIGFNFDFPCNVTITGNQAIDNTHVGIWLSPSLNDTVSDNIVVNNHKNGIQIDHTLGGTFIINNTITGSGQYGVFIINCFYNVVLSGNMMSNNYRNLLINGWHSSHFKHSIDTSNLADGNPVFYIMGKRDLVINTTTHPQIGYLALVECDNITVEGLALDGKGQGLMLVCTNNTEIVRNRFSSNNGPGVFFAWSSSNNIRHNSFENNTRGIMLSFSSDNIVSQNSLENNGQGLFFASSSGNVIYHNNFGNNTVQVFDASTVNASLAQSVNVWDDGYPSGGNYWSDYNRTDANDDGIGDTPYIVNANNTDRFPLMHPWNLEFLHSDIDQDGIVNIIDVTIVAAAYGSTPDSAKWNELADLDDNNQINIIDVALVAKDYGRTV